ncbi:MAG: cation:proton antiporter, partial [Nanoarchaeota archaeon]
ASLITGLGQIIFTFLIGYIIIKYFLNFSILDSAYISIALTFSSTIIIVKLLSEKQDLQSLYGRISVGFLLVQDFVAIIILVLLVAIQQESQIPSLIFLIIAKALLFFLFVFLFSKYILTYLFNKIAKSQELLFLSSITLPFLFIIISRYLGFSIEIGAFLAGLSLANLPYRAEITNKVKPLRDFFITLFFVILGTQFVVRSTNIIIPAIILSLFVLIGNPLIVTILMGLLGYRKRTSFYAGLTVAQISEFSLIIAFLGLKLGHINEEVVSLIVLVGLITITTSVYMIHHNHKLYKFLEPYLDIFEKDLTLEDIYQIEKKFSKHTIIFGCHRLGYNIVDLLKSLKKKIIVVDFDPVIIEKLTKDNIKAIYGDLADLEIFDKLNLEEAEFVISTIPNKQDNLILVKKVKSLNKNARVIVTAQQNEEAFELYKAGADYVILPYTISGERVADILRIAIKDKHILDEIRSRHIRTIVGNEFV